MLTSLLLLHIQAFKFSVYVCKHIHQILANFWWAKGKVCLRHVEISIVVPNMIVSFPSSVVIKESWRIFIDDESIMM